ncbi:MAG: hypothetical protein EOM14_13855 [Clostridia bacterium]|nr:hypothetical protein [Clostridia bacterium]
MPDYRKMYFALFNAVTNSITYLQYAQREAEQTYLDSEEPPLTVLPTPDEESTKSLKKPQ